MADRIPPADEYTYIFPLENCRSIVGCDGRKLALDPEEYKAVKIRTLIEMFDKAFQGDATVNIPDMGLENTADVRKSLDKVLSAIETKDMNALAALQISDDEKTACFERMDLQLKYMITILSDFVPAEQKLYLEQVAAAGFYTVHRWIAEIEQIYNILKICAI